MCAIQAAGRNQKQIPRTARPVSVCLQALFWRQVEACQYHVADSPGRLMSWSVPDGTSDPLTGEPLHDDLLISAALSAVLDGIAWYDPAPALVVRGTDPIFDLDKGDF